MPTRTFAALTAAVASCAVLVACSDDDPSGSDGGNPPINPPSASIQPSGAPGEALPHSGAPKVENPIADTSRWEGDPCTTISASQLSGLGLQAPAPQREDLPNLGPGCFWEFDAETVSGFSVSFDSQAAGKGLSNLYKHRELGSAKVFEELPPIEGYPAIVVMLEKDRRAEGSCAVAVGIRDDLTVGVDMTADPSIPQGKDPCGWAAKVAALAVQTMKGSS
jgi:hypothetical protein